MKIEELVELIDELNDELCDNCIETDYCFHLITGGGVDLIKVSMWDIGDDITLWNSEDDEVCEFFDVYPYGKEIMKEFLILKVEQVSNDLSLLSELIKS